MDYGRLVEEVRALDFIQDQDTADAALKAVLGIYMSSIEQSRAERLAQVLPEPLTMESLRGQQTTVTKVTPDQYVNEITNQFKISPEQARQLIHTVFQVVTRETTGFDIDELKAFT